MLPPRRRDLFALVGLAPLALAKSWDSRPFPQWPAAYVDKLLSDSPWAKPSTVAFEFEGEQHLAPASAFAQIGFPGGGGIPGLGWPSGGGRGGGAPPSTPAGGGRIPSIRAEMYLTTRWASALPIRQATALDQVGADGLDSKRARAVLEGSPDAYVIEIPGFPAGMIRQGAARFEADLAKSAQLFVPGRKALRADSARVPEHGMHLMATLRFPRFEGLTPGDSFVEFTAESGRIQLRERFKLKDMLYGGQLEL